MLSFMPNFSLSFTVKYKRRADGHRAITIIKNPKNKIVIEAPDWEGILCHLYTKNLGKNTFKVTRLHSILELTRQEEDVFSSAEKKQIDREHQQCLASDLLASSTDYAYDFTKKIFSSRNFSKIPHCTIPNFINEEFQFGKNKKTAIKIFRTHCPGHPISTRHRSVFIVGSVEKRKGVDIAIQIAQKLISKNPNVHFYFLGHLEKENSHLTLNKKYTRQAIEGLLEQKFKKNIHICGYFPYKKLHQIYALSDTFLFCYLHDNFPGALIEASLSGKNIVYLNRAGCKEMMYYKGKQLALPFNARTKEKIIDTGVKMLIKSLQSPYQYTAKQIRKKYLTKKIMKALCHAYKF